jgi:hypothetical protein
MLCVTPGSASWKSISFFASQMNFYCIDEIFHAQKREFFLNNSKKSVKVMRH